MYACRITLLHYGSLLSLLLYFFLSGFSFTDTENLQDGSEREGGSLFLTTTFACSQTLRYYFQLCI